MDVLSWLYLWNMMIRSPRSSLVPCLFHSMYLCLSFFFFFSSRRRHTRFDCDWSSDVCSSDLIRDQDSHPDTSAMQASTCRESSFAMASKRDKDSRNFEVSFFRPNRSSS